MKNSLQAQGVFELFCRDKNGGLFSYRKATNLVTNAALNHLRDLLRPGAVPITAWNLVLIAASPIIDQDDTHDDHPGWTEFVGYDETERPAWQMVVVDDEDGALSNEGFEATFTMTDEAIIGGVGLVGGGPEPEEKGNTDADTLLFSAAELDDGDTTYPAEFEVTVRYTLRITRPE